MIDNIDDSRDDRVTEDSIEDTDELLMIVEDTKEEMLNSEDGIEVDDAKDVEDSTLEDKMLEDTLLLSKIIDEIADEELGTLEVTNDEDTTDEDEKYDEEDTQSQETYEKAVALADAEVGATYEAVSVEAAGKTDVMLLSSKTEDEIANRELSTLGLGTLGEMASVVVAREEDTRDDIEAEETKTVVLSKVVDEIANTELDRLELGTLEVTSDEVAKVEETIDENDSEDETEVLSKTAVELANTELRTLEIGTLDETASDEVARVEETIDENDDDGYDEEVDEQSHETYEKAVAEALTEDNVGAGAEYEADKTVWLEDRSCDSRVEFAR